MVNLTVFTPTYNRKNTLPRLYESLKRQTSTDFKWLIIDDGSIDDTQEIVKQWQEEDNPFAIQYFWKENGGLHTAYNSAIEKMDTVLAVCIDSDDYMPDDAVEIILDTWETRGNKKYAGITGLDFDTKGNVIGGYLPEVESINLFDLKNGRLKVKKGDKKHVVRVDLYKEVAPMPVFSGEKFFNPSYMHNLISRKYNFIPLNKCLCIVEYQNDGMGSNMYKQYLNSPNSFLELRKVMLRYGNLTLKERIKTEIHFCNEAILAHKWGKEFVNRNDKGIMALFTPIGYIMSVVTKIKGRK